MRKKLWQCFACKGQFNKFGDFTTIEIRENLTLSKKKSEGSANLKIMFFFVFLLSLFSDIKNSLVHTFSQQNMFDWQNIVSINQKTSRFRVSYKIHGFYTLYIKDKIM